MNVIKDKELDRGAKVIKLKLHQLCGTYGEADVAEWSHTSIHMIRKWRNVNEEAYHIPAANLRALSKRLSTMKDDIFIKDFTDSSQCVILSPPGIANGVVDDDLKQLLKAAGEAATCFDSGDSSGYDASMMALKVVLKNLKEEGKAL